LFSGKSAPKCCGITRYWPTLNQVYQLQYATNLIAPVWKDLGSPVTATNNAAAAADVMGADSQRFYRVRLWP